LGEPRAQASGDQFSRFIAILLRRQREARGRRRTRHGALDTERLQERRPLAIGDRHHHHVALIAGAECVAVSAIEEVPIGPALRAIHLDIGDVTQVGHHAHGDIRQRQSDHLPASGVPALRSAASTATASVNPASPSHAGST